MLESLDPSLLFAAMLFLAAFGAGWELGELQKFLHKRRLQRARMKTWRGE